MKVSIITPVYNAQRFISDTIESVINQTYKDWEMILVDDCSSDESEKIIKNFMSVDSRIKYVKLNKNSGAAVARNTGIKSATGRFIAFIDSDDMWDTHKLEYQIKFMKDNNVGFSFTSYELISEDGTLKNKIIKVPEVEVDYDFLLKNTIIGCLTVVIDRNLIKDIEMPLLRTRQDLATWLSILKNGYNAYGLDKVLAKYRIVDTSISSNKFKVAQQNWYLYRKIEKLSLVKSIYVFSCYAFNAVKKRI